LHSRYRGTKWMNFQHNIPSFEQIQKLDGPRPYW
jgi:hypothetical protein